LRTFSGRSGCAFLVFCGNHISPNDDKTIRFQDLRHTYASLLLAQGEGIKYVQVRMGHSSPTVTLNVYAHLMKDENQEAAVRLENSIL
jgi:integrase